MVLFPLNPHLWFDNYTANYSSSFQLYKANQINFLYCIFSFPYTSSDGDYGNELESREKKQSRRRRVFGNDGGVWWVSITFFMVITSTIVSREQERETSGNWMWIENVIQLFQYQ